MRNTLPIIATLAPIPAIPTLLAGCGIPEIVAESHAFAISLFQVAQVAARSVGGRYRGADFAEELAARVACRLLRYKSLGRPILQLKALVWRVTRQQSAATVKEQLRHGESMGDEAGWMAVDPRPAFLGVECGVWLDQLLALLPPRWRAIDAEYIRRILAGELKGDVTSDLELDSSYSHRLKKRLEAAMRRLEGGGSAEKSRTVPVNSPPASCNCNRLPELMMTDGIRVYTVLCTACGFGRRRNWRKPR